MARLIVRVSMALTALLAEVVETMTQLADITATARFPAPSCGSPPLSANRSTNRGVWRMLVIGMGKLGGRELNVSSTSITSSFTRKTAKPQGRLAADDISKVYDFFTRLGDG